MALQIHHPDPFQTLHYAPDPISKLRQPTSCQCLLRSTSRPHALRTTDRTQAIEDVRFQALEEHFQHGIGQAAGRSLGEEAGNGGCEVEFCWRGHVVGGGEEGGCAVGRGSASFRRG